MAKHGEKVQTRGGGVVGRLQTRLKRYLALAAGFGLARAVTSNAYITAFGARFGDNLGFVADTTFSLLTNGLSVLLTLGLVVLAMRPARKPRLPIDGAGPLGHGIPLPLVFFSIVVLAIGYVMGAAGLFALLPSVVGEGVCALAYALGMIVLTLAWFEPFVFADDMRRSIRSLVGGYLVQAGVFFGLSYLSGWALSVACVALLCVSVVLLAMLRRGAGEPADREPARTRLPLSDVTRELSGSLLCVFTLTAVVGLFHTSVIGNTLEHVVGAVPMTEALAIATVLLALVVFASHRVPQTSTVYRVLFPVMLVALSLLPFFSETLGSLSGMVMVVCYDLVGMAFVLLLVETARTCAAPPCVLMGIYQAGTQLALVIGLLLGTGLSQLHVGMDASYVTVLMLACIYLLSMVLTVLLRRRGVFGMRPQVDGGGGPSAMPGEMPAAGAGHGASDGADAHGSARGGTSAGPAGASDAPEARAQRRAQQQEVRERVGEQVEGFALAHGLTPREAEVFVQLARGRSAPVIASDLGITENTAWAHIKRVYAKLGVHGKQELIEFVEREIIAKG